MAASKEASRNTGEAGESKDFGNQITHGAARFLDAVDPETLPAEGWIDDLADRYERWERTGEANTADLSGWSE